MTTDRSKWELAILEVLEKHKGIATLEILYKEVPKLIKNTKTTSPEHDIRGYLYRLKKKKREIEQIGLSTYKLSRTNAENVIYQDIQNDDFEDTFFNLPENEIHGYVEGMLIEIGNLKKYETYTPDKNVIFNGEKLGNLALLTDIPNFTYPKIINKAKMIDVIWFQNGFPSITFDVEKSTDFSKALLRASEIQNFRTTYYMVALDKKEKQFKDRIDMVSFEKIKSFVRFITIKSVFDDYKNFVVNTKHKSHSLMYI